MKRMSFYSGLFCAGAALAGAPLLHADSPKPFDAAAAFGARTDVTGMKLSPDGMSVLFVTPNKDQSSVVYTLGLAPGAQAKVAYFVDGNPFHLNGCKWVANDRLVCSVYGLTLDKNNKLKIPLPITRMLAVNTDGSKMQLLTTQLSQFSAGSLQYDANVIDWLPDQDATVLMTKDYVPEERPDSVFKRASGGLEVDAVDTRTLAVKRVVAPRDDATTYITDGHGTVRIVQLRDPKAPPFGPGAGGSQIFMYRLKGSEDWHRLSTYNEADHSGFQPLAVDHDLNIAYGWKTLNGHRALYSMTLDESPTEKLVYSRPDVDLSGLVRIGRTNRVVGVSYSKDVGKSEYFADDIKQVVDALHQALPKASLVSVVDTSADGNKVLVFAGSDNDPGSYYIMDRQTNKLRKFLGTRAPLEAAKLAHEKPVTYTTADGTPVPGYLTLPPGVEDAHGLPAIVMPHGGPASRDEWGFDWLAQFYAARGFVVLQPEFRGSAGFGDDWFVNKGFKSWDLAAGDVVAAGNWLVKQGIADPSKLAVVGWSFGGYVALQSVAVDPTLFKAIVAIAPVTDLAAFKEQHHLYNDSALVSGYVGDGPHMHDGSPIAQAAKFKQPIMIFHGTADMNVSVDQSKSMDTALKAAGAHTELVLFNDHDHNLEDTTVRTDLLRQSDAFLRRSLGMSP